MLVNCSSCKKKFNIPDSAIAESGRLLQCGTCGNQWTQYPIVEKAVNEIKKKDLNKTKQPTNINEIKSLVKKKKRQVNLYSEEYLKKKYGLSIKDPPVNKNKKYRFSFFNHVIIIIVFLISLFGVLNLLKHIIIESYPFTEIYINYFYDFFNIVKENISNLLN
jgi:predicted Zn finger-like uncharacterized protein